MIRSFFVIRRVLLLFQISFQTLYDKNYVNQFLNDYNVKFLPFTQFEKLKYSKILNWKTYYLLLIIELVSRQVGLVSLCFGVRLQSLSSDRNRL
mgnify:CR=1 FL=1